MSTVPGKPRSYLTLRQAAQSTQLSERTLRRAIKNGRLRAHYIGRLIRIAEVDLVAFIESDAIDARN